MIMIMFIIMITVLSNDHGPLVWREPAGQLHKDPGPDK
jgi:hypothetical protein